MVYDTYSNYISTLDSIICFKSNPAYTYMLEHVSYNQGLEYHTILKKYYSEEEILEYCNLNDLYGEPKKCEYSFGTVSPTSLRYILHANLILDCIKEPVDIVEIGGGYGGLCLALYHFGKTFIKSYTIVDLDSASRLQNMYLSKHSLHINYKSSSTYGSDIENTNMFLISNYCFSEIDSVHQKKYIETLFPKVSHGFMAWNMIPLYDFGFHYTSEVEYPLTGPNNLYVKFYKINAIYK
jgi:hypothetical protein